MSMWDTLDAEDDLVAMERSCIRTFIGPEQLGTLLESWMRHEAADNAAFIKEFAPEVLLQEPDAIHYDDDIYVEEEGDVDLPAEDDLDFLA